MPRAILQVQHAVLLHQKTECLDCTSNGTSFAQSPVTGVNLEIPLEDADRHFVRSMSSVTFSLCHEILTVTINTGKHGT